MKRTVIVLIGLLMICTNLYAAGDLIVDGLLGVGNTAPVHELDVDGRIRGIMTPGGYDDRTFIGLTGNKIFNADVREGYTVTQSGSCAVLLSMLFDGDLTPSGNCSPTAADPTVITIEYPGKNTQGTAVVGWVSRYWNPVDFTIEMYDYNAAAWSTVASETGYDRDSYAKPVAGSYWNKMRFTVTKAAGTDGKLQLSELFLLYNEEPPYKGAYASLRGDTFYGDVNVLNGNVGIGTTTPSATLDVHGTIRSYNLYPGGGSGDPYRFLRLTDETAHWGGFLLNNTSATYGDGDDFAIFTYDHRDIVLQPGNGKIVLSSFASSKVGIGTNSPSQKLDVIGNTYISGDVGIGTATPGAKLDVAGNVNVTGTVTATDVITSGAGTLSTGSVSASGDITTSGSLGVGVTPASGTSLHVAGPVRIDDSLDMGGNTIENSTIMAGVLRGGNILGLVHDVLIRADRKYAVTVDRPMQSGTVAGLFDGQGFSGANWTTADLPVTITIDTGVMWHYWQGMAVFFKYDRRVSGVKFERYIDTDSSNGWDTNCDNDQGDLAWTTTFETTDNSEQTVIDRTYTNGVCKFRVTLSGTPHFADDIRIGEIAAWRDYYGQEGAFVRVTGDTIYGDLGVMDGFVGIGETSPTYAGTKLEVSGGDLRVTNGGGIYVDATQVADHVFEDNYELMGVGELAAYIDEHGHLPGIPEGSKKEEWARISLQDRDMKLLEKVEELTLYLIGQNTTIVEQRKMMEEQQKAIEELRTEIGMLKSAQ